MAEKPPPKVGKFISLMEILGYALETGEYKDPNDPRRSNPEFKRQINEMMDEIFAEEINSIHLVAKYERELLKRDAEIIKLRILLDLERKFDKRLKKMDEDLKNIFKDEADIEAPDKAEEYSRKAIEELRNAAREISEEYKKEFDEGRKERQQRISQQLRNILSSPNTPYKKPPGGPQ